MTPPSPSLSSLLPSLRLGSFNFGLGFSRKYSPFLSRCIDLKLDIVALQEVADPVLSSKKLFQYSFVHAPGPSQHAAGVALLISPKLVPLCHSYKRSDSGRLIGAVLELSPSQQTLVVSVYMPSGLDHRSARDEAVIEAQALYDELL